MNTPDLEAEARYTPFFERASAVISPEDASSENVDDFAQSDRETVMISVRVVVHYFEIK